MLAHVIGSSIASNAKPIVSLAARGPNSNMAEATDARGEMRSTAQSQPHKRATNLPHNRGKAALHLFGCQVECESWSPAPLNNEITNDCTPSNQGSE